MKSRKFTKVVSWAIIIAMVATTVLTIGSAAAFAGEKEELNDIRGHWAEQTIQRWYGRGIINGNNGQFRPNDYIKRKDAAVIVARWLGVSSLSEGSINKDRDKADTKLNESIKNLNGYYADSVKQLYRMGIIKGSGADLNLDGLMKREEVAVLFSNILGNEEYTTKEISKYTDKEDISDWAMQAMEGMVEDKILKGNNKRLNPRAEITRAEFMQVLEGIGAEYIVSEKDNSIDTKSDTVVTTNSDGRNVGLSNCTIGGKLSILGVSVIKLENVDVASDVIIWADTIECNNSKIDKLVVHGENSKVKVDNNVGNIEVNDKNISITGEFKGALRIKPNCSAVIGGKVISNKDLKETLEYTAKSDIGLENIVIDSKLKIDGTITIKARQTLENAGILIGQCGSVPTKENNKGLLAGTGNTGTFEIRGKAGETSCYRLFTEKNGKVEYSNPVIVTPYKFDTTMKTKPYSYKVAGDVITEVSKQVELTVTGTEIPKIKSLWVVSGASGVGIDEASLTKANLIHSNYNNTELRYRADVINKVNGNKNMGVHTDFGYVIEVDGGEKLESYPVIKESLNQNNITIKTGNCTVTDGIVMVKNNDVGTLLKSDTVGVAISTSGSWSIDSDWERIPGTNILAGKFDVSLGNKGYSRFTYVAYAKTSKGTTYGEIKEFTGSKPEFTGLIDMHMSKERNSCVINIEVAGGEVDVNTSMFELTLDNEAVSKGSLSKLGGTYYNGNLIVTLKGLVVNKEYILKITPKNAESVGEKLSLRVSTK